MKGYVKLELDKANSSKGDTVYNVVDKHNEVLGKVYIQHDWKKWVFSPESFAEVFFDSVCLNRIAELMKDLN